MDKDFSSELSGDVDLVEGEVIASGDYKGKGAWLSIKGGVSVTYLIDKLKEKTPAYIDVLLDMVKGAVK